MKESEMKKIGMKKAEVAICRVNVPAGATEMKFKFKDEEEGEKE